MTSISYRIYCIFIFYNVLHFTVISTVVALDYPIVRDLNFFDVVILKYFNLPLILL